MYKSIDSALFSISNKTPNYIDVYPMNQLNPKAKIVYRQIMCTSQREQKPDCPQNLM